MSSIKIESKQQGTLSTALFQQDRKFINSLFMSPPAEQKFILSELLYPSIKSLYPEVAKQVSQVMSYTFHHSELFHMLNCRHFFNMRMEEVLTIIKMCKEHLGFSSEIPQLLLMERQPLNSLLRVRLLGLVRHLCAESADIITSKLSALENSVILHMLHCYECLSVRVDEVRSQLQAGSVKQPLKAKNSLESIDQPIEIPAERHLLGDDLFSTIQGEQSKPPPQIPAQKNSPTPIQGQGGRIFSELRSVPLTLKLHQKILIKQLYPLIKSLYPSFYLELITAIKNIDNSELVHMLWCRGFLHSKLEGYLSKIKISGSDFLFHGKEAAISHAY